MDTESRTAGVLRRVFLILAFGVSGVLVLQLVLSSVTDDGNDAAGGTWEPMQRSDNREAWRRRRPEGATGVPKPIEAVADSTPISAPTQETASAAPTLGTAPTLSEIKVSFKQAPRSRRARRRSMEPRWVLPHTLLETVQGRRFIVEARASSLDAQGMPIVISPLWIATDPGMVEVSPANGNEVTITVFRDGESSLRIVSADVSKELPVQASYRGDKMIVRISQGK